MLQEFNFDGLVSPTHNYGGLATGNLASARSEGTVSRPREAALQGLEKMVMLARRGIPQGFLPPQLRPALAILRDLGFGGTDADVLERAHEEDPGLFAACSSSSSMWTANAATVAPSCDTADHRVHFTPANLVSHFHRAIEAGETAATLRAVFGDASRFVHHAPLPATPAFADEGAANHTRLSPRVSPAPAPAPGTPGLHLFVYGSAAEDPAREDGPQRFPARQTRAASEAIARLHRLPGDQVILLRQNPAAIDAGVFHNDVISVGHENLFLYHERAFAEPGPAIEKIRARFAALSEGGNEALHLIPVPEEEVTLQQAVDSYLFNSQIVTLPANDKDEDGLLMVCPVECREDAPVRRFIEDQLVEADTPIREVVYQDLRQSMRNGGGPACLRLRVPLTEDEANSVLSRALLTGSEACGTEAFLRDWIVRHYPETLVLEDLVDIERHRATAAALGELRTWMGLA